MSDVIEGEFKKEDEAPTEGIGIVGQDGKVHLHFFAMKTGVEMSIADALEFCKAIHGVALDELARRVSQTDAPAA